MNATDRKRIMRALAEDAKEYDRRNDAVLRAQSSTSWYELATAAEAKRAPKYLTWTGRK